jgi:DNA invertase Pin-like site-specific DNA recombinase
VANLVYKRVSTDQQSTARQNLVLDEAGIEDPVVFEEDPGTSSTPAVVRYLGWSAAWWRGV